MIVWNRIVAFFSQQPIAGKRLLPLSWLSGMLLGFSFAFNAGGMHLQAFRGVLFAQTSVIAILAVSLLPFVLCKLSFQLQQRWLILLICFLKSACFAYCAVTIGFACGSAAWLIRVLLLFTDCCTIPVLYFYCSYLISSNDGIGNWLSWVVHLYACMIPLIDHCFISPFLLSVLVC